MMYLSHWMSKKKSLWNEQLRSWRNTKIRGEEIGWPYGIQYWNCVLISQMRIPTRKLWTSVWQIAGNVDILIEFNGFAICLHYNENN